MLSDRKITAMLTGEILEGSIAKGCLQWGILSTLLCCMVVNEVKGGLDPTLWRTRVSLFGLGHHL
jgi:hypothetical protein